MSGFCYENDNGQINSVRTVAEGVWCTKCEFFEQDFTIEDISASGACESCGCIPADHDDVTLVVDEVKELGNGNSGRTS